MSMYSIDHTSRITPCSKRLRLVLILAFALMAMRVTAQAGETVPDSCDSSHAGFTPARSDSTQAAETQRGADSLEICRLKERVKLLERTLRIPPNSQKSHNVSPRYIRHRQRVAEGWMRIIPNQFTLQYAGSIGLASVGIGWHYGRGKHWETEMLVGFVPRYHARHAHYTFTLKERYVPWHCRLSSRWTLQPLTAGLFFNTISGGEFWRREPDKYPKRYYGFSSKIRSNVFLGQRIRYAVPSRHRVFHSAVSAYYELSSCDLYIVSKATNKSYPWDRTLSLAFGLCWEL